MKKTFKVVGAIFALGTIILLLLHVFLLFGLTKTMRDVVLPQIQEQTGIDVRVGGLSLHIPNGQLILKEVEVRNPTGFIKENAASVERVNVELDIPSLLKQKLILIKDIRVDDALVTVVRNKDGEINVVKLQEGLPKPKPVQEDGSTEGSDPSELPGEDPVSVDIPELLIEQLRIHAVLRYVDLQLDELDIATGPGAGRK